MFVAESEGLFFRIVELSELEEFSMFFLVNSYLRALALGEHNPHDFLLAIEGKIDDNLLNFGWRYQGSGEIIEGEDMSLDVCGGETELLYFYKAYTFMDDRAGVWKDLEVMTAVKHIYITLFSSLVEFGRFPSGEAYCAYVDARDNQGKNIVDYDTARSSERGTSSWIAEIIESNRAAPKVVEGAAKIVRGRACLSKGV